MTRGSGPSTSRAPGACEAAPASAFARLRRTALVLAALPLLAAVAFLAGFASFVVSLDRGERDPAGRADGIVVLTGGAGRIEDAIELLAKGLGGRLLITGVNERTTREAMKRAMPGARQILDCCVDLDYRARNTAGNAAEIARWVEANAFRSLIVVTSDYHLPRALAELDEALPDVVKTPYPVVASRAREEGGGGATPIRLLLSEYVKFVAVTLRTRAAGWWGRTGLAGARTRDPNRPGAVVRS